LKTQRGLLHLFDSVLPSGTRRDFERHNCSDHGNLPVWNNATITPRLPRRCKRRCRRSNRMASILRKTQDLWSQMALRRHEATSVPWSLSGEERTSSESSKLSAPWLC